MLPLLSSVPCLSATFETYTLGLFKMEGNAPSLPQNRSDRGIDSPSACSGFFIELIDRELRDRLTGLNDYDLSRTTTMDASLS